MIKLRKILFFLFTLVYIILCPTLIMYSLGIVIKPGQEKVIKTGVIFISSVPSGADVYLDGKKTNKETPTLIDNLLPGIYTVELHAKKYQPWKNNISVSAEKATPFENILLIPQPLKIKELSPLPFAHLLPLESHSYILVTTGRTLDDIYLHIWDEGLTQNLLLNSENQPAKIRKLFPNDFVDREAQLTKWYSIENSPYLLFEIEKDTRKKLLWIDPLFGTPKIEDITELFPTFAKDIQWSPTDARHLLAFQNQNINHIDLATKAIYPNTLQNVQTFCEHEDNIFTLKMDNNIVKSNYSGTKNESISLDPTVSRLLMQYAPINQMHVINDQFILMLGKHGEVISTQSPFLITQSNIQHVNINKKPGRILLWGPTAIGFIELSKKSPLHEDILSSIQWLTQKGQSITDAFWVNDGSYIIYVDDNTIHLAYANSNPFENTHVISKIQKNSRIVYSDKLGKIFFLHPYSHTLSSIEIVPQRNLIPSINFEHSLKDPKP